MTRRRVAADEAPRSRAVLQAYRQAIERIQAEPGAALALYAEATGLAPAAIRPGWDVAIYGLNLDWSAIAAVQQQRAWARGAGYPDAGASPGVLSLFAAGPLRAVRRARSASRNRPGAGRDEAPSAVDPEHRRLPRRAAGAGRGDGGEPRAHAHGAGRDRDPVRLRERLDDFSAASDSLLLYGADPRLWRAFEADARQLRERLGAFGDAHPDARRAARQMEIIVDDLEAAGVRAPAAPAPAPRRPPPAAPWARAASARAHEPGRRPRRGPGYGRRQPAAHAPAGGRAERHLDRRRLRRRGAAVRRHLRARLHPDPPARRRAHPGAVRDGRAPARGRHRRARAVTGDDEIAELSHAFNRMVEQREQAEARLREHEATLEHQRRMLAETQRIARVGGWRLQVADMRLEWTDETYRILGLDPGAITPSREAFLAHVHPDDRHLLQGERETLVAGRRRDDLEFRIVRGDGELRHVHERVEIERGGNGEVVFVIGTIQDVTAQRQLDFTCASTAA
ncbi:MAG: PAS domain-containing protein [Halofilum sp. (in: g-proteobacteria)]|nr:PAS domain-containing protein [Halofilum sp. (in: g-proteobacteria)]